MEDINNLSSFYANEEGNSHGFMQFPFGNFGK